MDGGPDRLRCAHRRQHPRAVACQLDGANALDLAQFVEARRAARRRCRAARCRGRSRRAALPAPCASRRPPLAAAPRTPRHSPPPAAGVAAAPRARRAAPARRARRGSSRSITRSSPRRIGRACSVTSDKRENVPSSASIHAHRAAGDQLADDAAPERPPSVGADAERRQAVVVPLRHRVGVLAAQHARRCAPRRTAGRCDTPPTAPSAPRWCRRRCRPAGGAVVAMAAGAAPAPRRSRPAAPRVRQPAVSVSAIIASSRARMTCFCASGAADCASQWRARAMSSPPYSSSVSAGSPSRPARPICW